MKPLPLSPAARMQMVLNMLDTNVYAEDGVTVIGTKEPMITREQAMTLLHMSEQDETEEVK